MATSWKEALADKIDAVLAEEIDVFDSQVQLRKQGKMDEKVFAETRLRRGAYGQRYDNGQRWDGIETKELVYPSGELTKGPMTVWDAPGMMRIKIPYGGLNASQLECIADLAEEYSDSILHVTTRQDIQLHFIHIEDTPDLMRRLGAVGITTREACGNSVRNVTGCPTAGVCTSESFDTTPYTEAIFRFLLGHKDAQDFGRKMKIAVSGCAGEACALAMMHDVGLVAQLRDGQRGFTIYVGGGLGSVPQQAQLLSEFTSEEELMPTLQCVCRLFGRLGEKKMRSKARIKFLIRDLGIEKFRELVADERKVLPHDPAWTDWIADKAVAEETALHPGATLSADAELPEGYAAWAKYNAKPQVQTGYSTAKVTMPLGDFTAHQARTLADLAREFVGETTGIRLTVDQNFVFRFVPDARLPDLYSKLAAAGLAEIGADTIIDITSCPGTDTCKLGIAASRSLTGRLRSHLAGKFIELDEVVRGLTIKVSGCFNSCGQHHIADLGFYGVTRKRHGRSVPHFHVFLGGKLLDNAGAFGLGTIAVPSKRIPEVVDRFTDFYVKGREQDESFHDFVNRVGKLEFKKLVKDLTEVLPYEEDSDLYKDWGDPRDYTTGDMGVGECAGEVVETVDFGLAEAERVVFEAQLALDAGDGKRAVDQALNSMFTAAKALVYTQFVDITNDREQIVAEFKARLLEPKIFWDKFAGDKFANYFFDAVAKPLDGSDKELAHQRVEEATLFIEACHSCNNSLATV